LRREKGSLDIKEIIVEVRDLFSQENVTFTAILLFSWFAKYMGIVVTQH
jgi:hypothetical protein